MIKVNMYGLMPNNRIQDSNIPIYRTYNELVKGMSSVFSLIKEIYTDQVYSFSFPIELLKDDETRVKLFMLIPSMITNERVKADLLRDGSKFQIKSYLILPTSETLLIQDFNKIYTNLSTIEKISIDKLKANDKTKKETFEQFRDRMLSLKNNATTVKDIMMACTGLAYIYELIDQFIEDHREDLQSKMFSSIKEIRQEQQENEELSNELEMINKHCRTLLKDDVEDRFLQCLYNGEEITQEEMIDKLSNHILYKEDADNTKIFIGDTLDDEYRIETEKLIIVREYGGKMRFFVK